MAKPLSHGHAINVVRMLYERQGFEMHGRTPGGDITKELGQNIEEAKLGALFAMIDEIIFILRYQNYYLTSSALHTKDKRATTYLRFCTGMIATLSSIRVLSGMGLDLSARVQLRYYYELTLLWSRIINDNEAMIDFENTKIEMTNDFWHRYISRRKCETYLFEGVNAGTFKWHGALVKDRIDDIYKRLSIGAHPGLWGLYLDTMADFGMMSDGMVVRGPDQATPFTLDAAILLSTLPFALGDADDWQFEAPELFEASKIYPPHPNMQSWTDYCRALRRMIAGIALFSFRFTTELGGGTWGKPKDAEPEKA